MIRLHRLYDPQNGKGQSVGGRNIRGRSVGGVEMSLGSKYSGSKCRWGPNVPGVEVSVGSKCPWGPNVGGVEVSVGSKCLWGRNGCEPG